MDPCSYARGARVVSPGITRGDFPIVSSVRTPIRVRVRVRVRSSDDWVYRQDVGEAFGITLIWDGVCREVCVGYPASFRGVWDIYRAI